MKERYNRQALIQLASNSISALGELTALPGSPSWILNRVRNGKIKRQTSLFVLLLSLICKSVNPSTNYINKIQLAFICDHRHFIIGLFGPSPPSKQRKISHFMAKTYNIREVAQIDKKPSCRQDSRPYCQKLQESRDLGHAHFKGNLFVHCPYKAVYQI